MFTVNMDSDTRAYFTCVTMMISLPTGSKIFNWLCTYLSSATLFILSSAVLFVLIFVLTLTIGGSTGVILGNVVVDIGLHDTYYVVTHFHFILSLGTVIAIFSSLMLFSISLYSNVIFQSNTSCISLYHIFLMFVGILLTFTPLHILGFNVIPRRVPDFPDIVACWNYLSSLGSVLSLISYLYITTQ